MHKYKLLSKKGEGTFSEVLKSQSIKTGRYVAIKCMKNRFESIDQVNNLREIQALRRLQGHANIITLHEVLYDEPTGRLALVFELMDMNLYELIRGRRHYVPEEKVRTFMRSLLRALDHMHRNGIFHRDVKPENLLLQEDTLKLADLGSCRGIYSRPPYTEYISTRWYRAPECLLTDGFYSYKMDLFAAGCVWFEVMALFPLFPGQNEMDQLQKIHGILGTPNEEVLRKFKLNSDVAFPEKKGTGIDHLIPHASLDVLSVLKKLLRYDPEERITARHGLLSPYFEEVPERTVPLHTNSIEQAPTSTFYRTGGNQSTVSDNHDTDRHHESTHHAKDQAQAKTNLPPIHAKNQTKHMKPFKFKPKNFGLHSTMSGFGGNYGNTGGNAYLSGMNATMHKSKFFKKSSMR
ncbi:unnamed protein product [Amoebophrya sp. A120]|nr:unnamed protein product [Amoebophrya sp. A120]|eukprot:GSA120T00019237001.1